MNEVSSKLITASSRYIRLSPNKARRVIDQIRGKKYEEALLILEFMPYRPCKIIKKILKTAVANITHNYGYTQKNIRIKQAFVNEGPKLKRFQPRAQGRAFPIRKPTCHIIIKITNN